MSRYGRYETKVYVGNLGTGAGKGELERAFSYYGPLRTVWIARNPPGFAFVEFEDPRDAEDAVLGLDGKIICGSRVRVEVSTGMPRRSRYDRPPARRPFDPNDRCYECGEKGHYAYDCHRYSRRRRSRYVWERCGWVASPLDFLFLFCRSRSASYRRSRSISPPHNGVEGNLVVAVSINFIFLQSLAFIGNFVGLHSWANLNLLAEVRNLCIFTLNDHF
uniref:Serine and arginine rich splicing factor 7 n=1 Tax=Anas platyrhynchos platyrhynchos TaxID=8840 RepID=U3IXJ5_ANAPP